MTYTKHNELLAKRKQLFIDLENVQNHIENAIRYGNPVCEFTTVKRAIKEELRAVEAKLGN
jgi:hypothetical protein